MGYDLILHPQVVALRRRALAQTMQWKCLDCRSTFEGPRDHTPEHGCLECGSRQVIDINVQFVGYIKAKRRYGDARGSTIR